VGHWCWLLLLSNHKQKDVHSSLPITQTNLCQWMNASKGMKKKHSDRESPLRVGAALWYRYTAHSDLSFLFV
jgi:hypothetical protein